MKIALIWPHGFDPNYILPLSLGYLKSNVNNDDHEIKIIDCALHNLKGNSQTLIKIISNFQPDIVGISCWSTNYNEVCKTLKTIRLFDEKIVRVVGGCHATAYPESLIEEIRERVDLLEVIGPHVKLKKNGVKFVEDNISKIRECWNSLDNS